MNINFRFDLRHIRAFMVVAELLHFKKAADHLCITQPALSRLIKGLEEAVGAELLLRTTRQVSLTEAGKLLLAESQEAWRRFERGVHLAQLASRGDIGRISVAYNDFSINGVLPNILESFKEKHPDITIELTHMPSHEQHKAIQDCRIDAGFLIGPLDMDGIETHSSAVEKLVAILPLKHPLCQRTSLDIAELKDERFILGAESSWKEFRNYLFRACQKAGFTPNIIQEATTSTGIFGLVAANMGISVYSECVSKFCREDLCIIPINGEENRIETIAAWNKLHITPSFSLFIRHLQSELNL